MTQDKLRSAVRDFVAMIFLCDDVLPVPITRDDAAYTLSNWTAEDIEYPAGMTPDMLTDTWNEMLMEDNSNE